MVEKEQLIQEVERTNLLTLIGGDITITINVPDDKLLDLLYLLDCWECGSTSEEFEPTRRKALFKYKGTE